jgi:ankyrin repeat protein/predicted phosphodiesterase
MKKYALLIACNKYEDPNIPELKTPIRDAEELKKILEDPEKGDFNGVKILHNEECTVVRKAIKNLFTDNKKPDDLLVLYYSGHAKRDDDDGVLYLEVKNTEKNDLDTTGIDTNEIKKFMKKSKAKKQILLLDCCFSGGFEENARGEETCFNSEDLYQEGKGSITLTSSSRFQLSYESFSTLNLEEIYNLKNLLEKLTVINGNLKEKIWKFFSYEMQHYFFQKYSEESIDSYKEKIREGLNDFIKQASLSKEELNNLDLNDEAKEILAKIDISKDDKERLNRLVLEALFPESIHKSPGHGIFTAGLIKGLNGEAVDISKKSITIDNLYDYVHEFVTNMYKNQTPKKWGKEIEGKPIIIAKNPLFKSKVTNMAIIENKADINAKIVEGNTPLHEAAFYEYIDIIKLLIDKGADINAKTNRQETPLHIAITKNHIDIIKLLIDRGADINVENVDKKYNVPNSNSFNTKQKVFLLLYKEYQKDIPQFKCLFQNITKKSEELGIDDKAFTIAVDKLQNEEYITGADIFESIPGFDDNNILPPIKSLNPNSNIKITRNGFKYAEKLDSGNFINVNNSELEDIIKKDFSKLELNNKEKILLLIYIEYQKDLFSMFMFKLKIKEVINQLDISLQEFIIVVDKLQNEGYITGKNINTQYINLDFINTIKITKDGIKYIEELIEMKKVIHSQNKQNNIIQGKKNLDNSKDESHYEEIIKMKSLISLDLFNKGCELFKKNQEKEAFVFFNKVVEFDPEFHDGDCNVSDNKGYTPLHLAVIENNEKLVKLFLLNKADINKQDGSFSTPLHLAAHRGFLELVTLLINSGANLDIKTNGGHIALDLALLNNHKNIADLLRNQGALSNIPSQEVKEIIPGKVKSDTTIKIEIPPVSFATPIVDKKPFILPEMVSIPEGTFQMGSNYKPDEEPVHSVTVSSFYMSEIKLLHISDLHFNGTNTDRYDSNKVIGPLLKSVDEENPELIFVTGDIAFSGDEKDYKLATEFFNNLLERANLSKDYLWIVPGNHDVKRTKFQNRPAINDGQTSDIFFGTPYESEPFLLKFKNYKNFVKDFFPEREFSEGDIVHKPSVINLNGFPIGILPINSCFSSQDDNDIGKLWVGDRTIRERTEYLKGLNPSIIISLLHHPFSYFHEAERANEWLIYNSHIIMMGHLHRSDMQTISTTAGKSVIISAGAAYQGSKWPCRAWFITLDIEKQNVELKPMKYVDRPGFDKWICDSEVFPDSSKNKVKLPPFFNTPYIETNTEQNTTAHVIKPKDRIIKNVKKPTVPHGVCPSF